MCRDCSAASYRLPRLRGRGTAFSQQGAGIGTRGPGETQLEVDRRRILRRIAKLESEIKDITRVRRNQRKSRARSRLSTARAPSSVIRSRS